MTPDYAIELWDINGQMVADVSRLSSNRKYSLKLNDIETINFDIDLDQFQKLCADIGSHPRTVLSPARTEVKIKRNGSYVVAGQVVGVVGSLEENDKKLSIRADGYLNYFLQRYIKKNYAGVDRSQIAWDAINTTQTQTNGSFGITQGTLATTMNSDREADYDEIKDLIIDYTWHAGASSTANYDFEFTPNKVFNTYTRKGSDKPEIRLIYPYNVVSLTNEVNGSTVANKIIGLGAGIGDERSESIKSDATSQANYRVREKKSLFNSVSTQTVLDNNTNGVLNIYNQVLEIPEVKVIPDILDLNTLQTGDSVHLKIEGNSYFDTIDGLYRINEISVSLDENNSEDVSLRFYNPKDGGALESA